MKKKALSILLALALCLCLFPATAFAVDFAMFDAPAESGYWHNLTLDEADKLLNSMFQKTGDSTIFVYYSLGCPYSADYIPEFASFANSERVEIYAYGKDTDDSASNLRITSNMVNGNTSLGWPTVFTYNAQTKQFGFLNTAYGVDMLKEFLEAEGLYTPSPTSSSSPGTSSSTGTAASDFTIENGILTSYSGSGGDVVIPDGVVEIGSRAFLDCAGLTSVTISDGVTTIGEGAFANCGGLTSITIPTSVTSIGDQAFKGCSNLENVYYDGIKQQWDAVSIGDNNDGLNGYTVYHSDGTTSHYIDLNSVSGFMYNTATNVMTQYVGPGGDVVIPDGATGIGAAAFANCTGLTSVVIPEGVTSIGNGAFFNCANLTSVTIPSTVTSIGDQAFEGCESLTSVTIPEGVISIGAHAFEDCKSLTSVTIPNSVASIGDLAFSACTSLTSVTIPDNVFSIGNFAFSNCTSLTNVTIPEGVTFIGVSAFSGCTSLTSVAIPEGVTTIREYTFDGCTGLTSVTIPSSVTYIGLMAFDGCDSLTDVYYGGPQAKWYTITFGLSNSALGAAARHSSDGDPVQAGPDFTVINGVLLQYKGSGGDVVIPKGVYSIGNKAFYQCKTLTSVTMLEGVTTIGNEAFKNCTGLTSVTMPEGLTTIGDEAFSGCRGLTSVTIPSTVTSIGMEAFYNCEKLASVTIPSGVTKLNHQTFCCCFSLTSVDIPDSVTSLEGGVFYSCESLTSVTIPASVTSLGNGVFRECTSLTSVSIPTSVKSIGWYAFIDCGKLNDIYYGGTQAQWNAISIGEDNDNLNSITIHYSSPLAASTVGGFGDVPADEYYAQPVLWAVNKNITVGTSGDAFSPDDTCTHIQIITFLWRAAGRPRSAVNAPVSASLAGVDDFVNAANWAYGEGIIGADFNPDAFCTRADTVNYMWKAFGSPGISADSDFTDVPSDAVYGTAVMWALDKGVTQGTDGTHFSPNDTCTRGQIATFLYRAYA